MPSPLPNAAVRRFAAVQGASLAIKIGAIALFLVLLAKFLGGF